MAHAKPRHPLGTPPSPTTRPAGRTRATCAHVPPFDPLARHAAIESALAMALHFMRRPCDSPTAQAANVWAATARTNRALTLLKVASFDLQTGRG